MNRKIIAATLLTVVVLAGCQGDNSSSNAKDKEAATAGQQLSTFLTNQPVPTFTWSQLRQNLIELETMQANTTATTSFFFNQGVKDPITVCPSIGMPIPASYQLTNPLQGAGDSQHALIAIGQLEATGVYTAGSTGTYVICIDGTGKAYAQYWEGFVSTVTGPAQWKDGQIVLTGKPSVDFSTQKKP